MNYRLVRRITFSFYLLFALIFCGLLVYWARGEVGRLQQYSAADLKYVEAVLKCQNKMSAVERVYSHLLLKRSNVNCRRVNLQLNVLAQVVTQLINREQGKIVESVHLNENLLSDIRLVQSAGKALADSLKSRDLDQDYLFGEAAVVMD